MKRAMKASRWKICFCPDCIRCSYSAAKWRVSCRTGSGARFRRACVRYCITISAGMQLLNSSYSLPRTLSNCFGVCSLSTSSATAPMKSCQSGSWIGCCSVNGYCCTLHASSVRMARRRLRSLLFEMRIASVGGSLRPSLCATWPSTLQTSSCEGAGIRKHKQRDRIGAITLHGLVQHSNKRQVPTYFSMVRRSACCAGLLSRSTSLRTTILNPLATEVPSAPPLSTGAVCAISLMSSCTTSRSRIPASLGLSSMWCAEQSSVSSTLLELNLNVRCSTFNRSADAPNISRNSAMIRVFLPAPEGPYTSICGKSPSPTNRFN
mmetsp:Transcript_20953/g.34604  ORF Transcript_20953/g.34604 Transcript_20953/m.34604 type:complete len:321 (+) Transcript_20953:553-1515(+)